MRSTIEYKTRAEAEKVKKRMQKLQPGSQVRIIVVKRYQVRW